MSGTPKLYEIINPSDCVTFEAESDAVAAAAVLALSQGAYACETAERETVLPILKFGGGEEWLAEHKEITALWEDTAGRLAIAAALESTAVCSIADRKALIAAVGNDPAAMERWNEARRTSLNDICGAARRLAEWFREPMEATA